MQFLKTFESSSNKDYLLFTVLFIVCIGLAVVSGVYGLVFGVVILVAIVCLAALIALFFNHRIGLYYILAYVFYMFLINKVAIVPFPLGVIVDLLCAITGLSLWINFHYNPDPLRTHPFRNVIGYFVLACVAMDVVQLGNPLGGGSFSNALVTFREAIYLISTFFIAYHTLDTKKEIVKFTYVWVIFSATVAVYGLKQEWFGLSDAEWYFLRSDPRKFELYVTWGHVRKWSFLTDPSIYGMMMALSSIFCFVLTLRKINWKLRTVLIGFTLMFLLAMSYSGTRTAFGIVPIGIAFYFLMTIDNPRMLAAGIATAIMALVLFFGPFYGPTLHRIRSTFNSSDPSMSFRDMKRKNLQKYIYTHPTGVGLGTANQIAGRYSITSDTDSGYLRTAIEKGILGLILQMGLFFAVIYVGVNTFFDSRDMLLRTLIAAYLAGILGIAVANFYQDAVDQKPMNILLASFFAIILRLNQFQTREGTQLNNNPL
jgi:putative inorganic carbon (HCO3(-)) transporter